MLEVLIATAALAVLAGIAVATLVQTSSAAKASKLRGDVTTINAAIKVYLASGGDLSVAKTTDQVLAKLKAKTSANRARRLTGISSSVVDERLAFRMQSTSEAQGSAPRARWDQGEMQFVVASSGAAGIKEFYFREPGDNDAQPSTEERSGTMLFAEKSGWIWDFQENAAPDVIPGPTVVPLGSPPPPPPYVPPVTPPPTPPAAGPSPIPLAEPVFPAPGGVFPIGSFPMAVTLTNPNPPGVSKIAYSIDSGNWQDYAGSLSAPSGSNVRAMAVALDSEWTHSGIVSEIYQEDTVILVAPVITTSADTFGLFFESSITVTLTDSNPAGTSTVRYRINGSSWQDYNAPFVLQGDSYLRGATIEAQALSSGSEQYLPSSVAQKGLARESLNLTGSTTGVFHTPVGPLGMITNLTGGGSNSLFQWGDATGSSAYSQSWMQYSGATIDNISDSVRFEVGDLNYYNGTIKSGSGATTVDLNIELTLDINGNVFTPFFDFTFELINSRNVAGDPWGSADFVRLDDPRASRTLVLNGYEFEFRLEFGDSTSDGFAAFDEFHVLENKDASVAVYGTLISLGPVASNSDPMVGGTAVATDAGTGTVADGVFQKEGYIDTLEHTVELSDEATVSQAIATDALVVAKSGLDDAFTASQEIDAALALADYTVAAALATDAEAGAAAAEVAALTAEQAAADANDAAVAAKLAASIDPTTEEQALIAIQAAADVDAIAADARIAADEATLYAASAVTAVDDFKASSLAAGSATEDDYVAYLAGIAKAEKVNARIARDAAAVAEADALAAAVNASDMLAAGRDIEANQFVNAVIEASARAEASAQDAEAASAAADAAAVEAKTVADTINDGYGSAGEAAFAADKARAFAAEARSFADSAAYAELQALSLISQPISIAPVEVVK